MDTGGKGCRSGDISRGRKQHTSRNTIPNEHTDMDILEPEEPKQQEILIPTASAPAIN